MTKRVDKTTWCGRCRAGRHCECAGKRRVLRGPLQPCECVICNKATQSTGASL